MNEKEHTEAGRPTIVQSAEGQMLQAFGDTIQIKLGGTQTGGNLVVGLATTPPGGGPPPHVHHNEDELFLILEGRFSVLANGEWTEVGPGGVAYTPRGNVHTFRNVGDTPGRFWVLTTPCGFESFFAKCADVFSAGGPPNMPRILEICAEHGLEFVPPLGGAAPEAA